ncbi:vWA domain-containing protein [Halalkalibacter urbisdiaboli]|uniref:vWA domain-containing protein n=1 Tax=Halalkalibacter urbisdiaboli TaxID=1960589 RepID=UPI001FDA38E4|nr:vWA domain-containing protein [Halalkalibacter urbisdiaboli]
MMNEQVTEIIFLLDRSGSMAGLEEDTIGGFNALVERQSQLDGDTLLTVVLFDDSYEILWNGIDAKNIKLTNQEYYVRGCTALLDAIGKTIVDVRARIAKATDVQKPGKVLFVITTDGMENASREFTYTKVKQLIHHQEDKHNWEFMFIGANMDAASEADHIGINMEHAYTFEASSSGVESMYLMVEEELTMRRQKP